MRISPTATLVLVNEGVTNKDTNHASLVEAAAAIDHVLQHAWKSEHGGNLHCRAGSPTLGPNEVKVSLQEDSTIPGAGGYHDDTSINCFRDGAPSFSDGDFAFTVIISHEVFETIMDPGANRWADAGNGTMVALEACDAVEGFSFKPEIPQGQPGYNISISDFLYQSFFDQDGEKPFSHTNAPTAAFKTAPDNGADYQIELSVDENGEQQVTAVGNIHPTRASAKARPDSRTSRRGVVFPKKSPDDTQPGTVAA